MKREAFVREYEHRLVRPVRPELNPVSEATGNITTSPCKCSLFTHGARKEISRNSFKGDHAFQVELEFGNVGICGGRKTGVPGDKTLGARTRTHIKLNPHMTPSPRIAPEPHWCQESALTTAPSLLLSDKMLVHRSSMSPVPIYTPG